MKITGKYIYADEYVLEGWKHIYWFEKLLRANAEALWGPDPLKPPKPATVLKLIKDESDEQ
jgi:hypothetical protein